MAVIGAHAQSRTIVRELLFRRNNPIVCGEARDSRLRIEFPIIDRQSSETAISH